MITESEVMPMLLHACPGFAQMWHEHLEWWRGEEPGIYNDTAELARYLVECYGKGATAEFEAAFAAIETLIREGDESARGAAIVGVLEDVQVLSSHEPFGPDVFLVWLGPLSRQAWQEIDALWSAAGGSLAGVLRLEQRSAARPPGSPTGSPPQAEPPLPASGPHREAQAWHSAAPPLRRPSVRPRHAQGGTMPSVFWSGKLTLPMRILVDANNLLSLLTGGADDVRGMKERVRRGYEGEYSDHVRHYDEHGYHLQDRSARIQLEGISFAGMRVLDVGCGTGALARVAFENGAQGVVCSDISAFMLKKAMEKEVAANVGRSFCQLDAEALPYKDGSFDAVMSGMTFGTLPNQQLAVDEMVRVVKPGGLVCVGAHGPEHYWEAIDASFRCISKRYILGYRLEWWPRDEEYVRGLFKGSNLEGIQTKRVIWRNEFADGFAAYDFFAAISSSWWYAKFPPHERARDSQRTRNYFQRKNVSIITDDIVVAYGYKPRSSPLEDAQP